MKRGTHHLAMVSLAGAHLWARDMKRGTHHLTGGTRLGATESSPPAATESSPLAATVVYTSNCGYTFFYPHISYAFFWGGVGNLGSLGKIGSI